jgi:signal peptidase
MAAFSSFQIMASLIGSPLLMVVNGYSMVPVFQPFDLLIMDAIDADEVKMGMIVAVDHRDEAHFFEGYIVHRVHQIEEKNGYPWVSTKGDNNSYADEPVPIDDVVAKVAYSIPMIGFVLGPPVNMIIIIVFLFLAFKSYQKQKTLSSA